jgi:hypothetical protein
MDNGNFSGRQIRDDTGTRCLQVNKLARGLGIPSNWGDFENNISG